MIEKTKIDEYIANKGVTCLYCNSLEVREYMFPQLNQDETISMSISCDNCEQEWSDIYTLTGIKEMENEV